MKKILTGSIHAAAILLLLISLALLHFSSADASLLSVLRQPNYLRSPAFEGRVSESVNDIFDYIDLRDLFEKNGVLNLNQVIAQADENGTTVSYTLKYLIQYARSMGYYLDAKNELQYDPSSATISQMQDEKEHQIRLTFRAYMPEYRPASPADGLITLGKLSQEALGYLAKYYIVRNKFFDQESNLKFRIVYESGARRMVYSNAEDLSPAEIQGLGRYLSTDSQSLAILSNLETPPNNLTPLLESRNPYTDGNYSMTLGIDTNFPVEDGFASSSQLYESQRLIAISALFLLLLSLLTAGISYIALASLTGTRDGKKRISLYPMDKIPVELGLLCFIFWSLAIDRLAPIFLDSLLLVAGDLSKPMLWTGMFRFLFKYLLFVPLSLSLIRTHKAESLWKNSLLHKLVSLLHYYTEAAAQTAPRFYSAVLFFLPNLLGVGLFAYLLFQFIENRSLMSFLYALLLLVILSLIDFYSWHITTGLTDAVTKQVKSERLRTDLITNVSHDLKTPLTSIINYVDLLKREDIANPRVQEYLRVLEQKSERLKTLTEDLVEASKASSGNVTMEFMDLNYGEILQQALGEFEDKLNAARLTVVETLPAEPVWILSDGRHLWRVIENLLNNCCKYALRNSRVYVDLYTEEEHAICTIKNISESPLNISPEELTERFVRGDVSRSTEGSGLGLSIAKSLTKLMKGELRIEIDGDLYKASIILPLAAGHEAPKESSTSLARETANSEI